jgi:hypothetical protein
MSAAWMFACRPALTTAWLKGHSGAVVDKGVLGGIVNGDDVVVKAVNGGRGHGARRAGR